MGLNYSSKHYQACKEVTAGLAGDKKIITDAAVVAGSPKKKKKKEKK